MDRCIRALMLTVLLVVCICVSGLSDVSAQTKRVLPKATFQKFTRPNGEELPVSNGMHLSPGLTRRKGAPVEVYPPGEPSLKGALVRWDSTRMPLCIWISNGQKLPEVPYAALQDTRVGQVKGLMKDPAQMAALPTAPGWSPTANEMVANGFEEWREFENEGLFSFCFVDDPKDAQILVFFTDRFAGSEGPGGTSTHGMTIAKMLPTAEIQAWEAANGRPHPQWPIVMELVMGEDLAKLQAEAAHEFGHALGIKAHSPYREDLMYENRIVEGLSPNDKATIRWLYRQKTPYMY